MASTSSQTERAESSGDNSDIIARLDHIQSQLERILKSNNGSHVPGLGKARFFSYEELVLSTNNFDTKSIIGSGGFGNVYRGCLNIAVKDLMQSGVQSDEQFLNEVKILSLVCHPNLVDIIGFCGSDGYRLLVLEYVPNGSLAEHLFAPLKGKPLNWNARVKIARGVAHGLRHLHRNKPSVINCDVKSANILVDENFNAKLCDFGVAKITPPDRSHVSNADVVGTYGYIDPHYQRTRQVSTRSDVYSYGAVLLEILSGRKAYDSSFRGVKRDLVAWARPIFRDRVKFREIVDPLLAYPDKGLQNVIIGF